MTTIRSVRDGAVVRLTLDRPDVRNAFDEVLIRELAEALAELADDGSARVVVLAGSGEAFCAGADLHWMRRMRDATYEENLADASALAHLLYRLYSLPQPTVARVHGAVIGGGNGLVAACDIAVASSDAVFGLSEVRLGLVPAVIGPYVVRRIGEGEARRLFLTGERVGAERAREMGLVSAVVEPGRLDEGVEAQVKLLLAGAPGAQRRCKELLEGLSALTLEEASEYTAEMIARMRAGPEAQEGMSAFLEKRKPRWQT